MAKKSTVKDTLKIEGKNYILKSPKKGESKTKAASRKKTLKKSYKFVRVIPCSGNKNCCRVYVWGKKCKKFK